TSLLRRASWPGGSTAFVAPSGHIASPSDASPRLLGRHAGRREVDPSAAAARLDEDLRLFQLAQGHAEAFPRREVLRQRDVTAGALPLADADELVERRVAALDRRLVDLLVLVDVVGSLAVDGEGPHLAAAPTEVVVGVLVDVELDQ